MQASSQPRELLARAMPCWSPGGFGGFGWNRKRWLGRVHGEATAVDDLVVSLVCHVSSLHASRLVLGEKGEEGCSRVAGFGSETERTCKRQLFGGRARRQAPSAPRTTPAAQDDLPTTLLLTRATSCPTFPAGLQRPLTIAPGIRRARLLLRTRLHSLFPPSPVRSCHGLFFAKPLLAAFFGADPRRGEALTRTLPRLRPCSRFLKGNGCVHRPRAGGVVSFAPSSVETRISPCQVRPLRTHATMCRDRNEGGRK